MANKQTAKFVYESKVSIIDEVRQGSKAVVTSGGIYSAIRDMSSSALLDSGYVADCIISVKKNNTVNLKDGVVTIGSETEQSTFFIPDGFAEDGVTPKFAYVTLEPGHIVDAIRHLKDGLIENGELAVLYDAEEDRVLLHPTRVGRLDNHGNITDGFYQYIFARAQNKRNPQGEYGPKVDRSSVTDNWTVWWDTTANKMKEYENDHWHVKKYSIPVALLSIEDGEITGFANDFTVAGYLERTVWINPGVTFNFPEGRRENETNTIITNPKTSGFDEDGVPTYQPIMTVAFDNNAPIEQTFNYYYDAETPAYNTIRSIIMDEICTDEDELTVSYTRNNGVRVILSPETYVLQSDLKTIVFADPFVLNQDEDRAHGGLAITASFKRIEEPVAEQFVYYYDPTSAAKNAIQYIKLSKRCLDVNTLSIKVTKNGSVSTLTPGTYMLADDAKTIMLDTPIQIQTTEDEQHGGVIVDTLFYNTIENTPMYVTNTWEILGPSDEYIFDNSKGHYVDLNGNKVICCRFAIINSGYVVPKNLRPKEPLCITAFTPRTCFTLADNDDIENIMALIGSATGETMSQVLTNIEEIEADILRRYNELNEKIDTTADEVKDEVDSIYVHNTGRETIGGIKTFTDSIVGNLSGTALYLNKTFGPNEILPMGIPVAYEGAEHGMSGDEIANPYNIIIGDVITDGELNIKCLDIATSANDVVDIPNRMSNTLYSKGDKFKVDISLSVTEPRYIIFEVLSGEGTEISMTHQYSNEDKCNVILTTNSKTTDPEKFITSVRIGSNYVIADEFRGVATKARWADLAEIYEADADYPVGTLVRFGGEKEITLANFGECNAVVSEKPAFLMNSEAKGLPIALMGRVPVRVFGAVKKFDKLKFNTVAPGTATVNGEGEPIAIALEDNDFIGEKLVLCVVKLKF